MSSSRAWLRHAGRSLAERLDRLRVTFETLRERLRAAVSEAVGQTVAGAVHEAVHAVLGEADRPAERSSGVYRDPDTPRGWWRDPAEPPWQDEPDHWQEYNDEEEPAPVASGPLPAAPATRLRDALVVGCESAAWWLRRWTGRFPVAAALTVVLLSATLAHVGGPLAAAGIGLVGSLVSLTTFGDTLRSGAAALKLFRGP